MWSTPLLASREKAAHQDCRGRVVDFRLAIVIEPGGLAQQAASGA
jgi:hypothetical protein